MRPLTAPPRIDRIGFVPLGQPPAPILRDLVGRVSRLVAVPCAVRTLSRPPDPLPLPGRNQVDADRLLQDLEARVDAPGEVLVGVTTHDIGHPIFTHFFGRARHGGGAAVVSVARLRPGFYGLPDDGALLLQRATREVLHELGHVAGLVHCDDPACLMRFAATVEAIDLRGARFCVACRAGLGSLVATRP